ncbi:MAG TPA: hypothetical protein VGF06_06340 [Terriglobales bacterium]|jgi:hypothetical protein
MPARPHLLLFVSAVCLSGALLPGRFGFGTYSVAGLLLLALALAACVAAIGSAPGIQPLAATPARHWRLPLVFIVLLHVGLAIAMLRWTPPEGVDVYLFQRDAVSALLHGANPYSITHQDLYGGNSFFYGPGIVENGRVQIGSPYPPLSLLFIIPAYLAGDLRYSYIAALVICALIAAALSASRFAVLAIALLLLSPITIYVLSRGWTEPLVLLTLACTCLAAVRRSRWLPLALGAFFASKQYAVLGAPFAALLLPSFSWKAYGKLLARAALVALLVTLPFALWNFHDFWRDIVLMQIVQPFRPDALSFSVLARRLGLPAIPLVLVAIAVAAATGWSLLKLPKHPAWFAGGFAFVMLVFFSLSKQAFVNYYFLVIGSLLLAALMAEGNSA